MAVLKTLGGVVLPDGLTWTNQYEPQGTSQKVDYTLQGTAVIYTQPFDRGHSIILSATINTAWFELPDVQSLVSLAKVSGSDLQFVWGTTLQSETHQVQFDHRSGAAVTFRPIIPEAPKYIGTIKLITI